MNEPGPREVDDGNGLLLVDKPSGVTSFRIVDHVRKALLREQPELDRPEAPDGRRPRKQRPRFKCGHAGTLDPLATGLLLVLTGKGSRLSTFLLGLDKSYLATVRFGCTTDTLDRDGRPQAMVPAPESVERVRDSLDAFRGRQEQVPPLISALKQNGRPLYERVRRGQDVAPPPPRAIEITRLEVAAERWGVAAETQPGVEAAQAELTAADGLIYEIDLLVHCSSGTYIRSLARDLGRTAGSEGLVQALRRLSVGPFSVDGAVTDVLACTGADLAGRLRPLAAALPHLPAMTVSAEEAAGLRQGRQPQQDWLERLSTPPLAAGKSGPLFTLLDEDGRLVAVAELATETGEAKLAAVIPVT